MTHTFRRLDGLPPYVFATIRELTLELRRAGEDVVDLGFGNPDLPSPDVAVAKLQEAAAKPHNHRYSRREGIPKLRAASPTSTGAASASSSTPRPRSSRTIGAKEGSSHLMWTLVEPGRRRARAGAVVPDPHRGADPRGRERAPRARWAPDQDFFANLADAWRALVAAAARHRALVPAQPDDRDASTSTFMQRVVEFAREREMLVVHDFAYADLGFDGYEPPSILQVPRRDGRRRRALHADEVVLDGRVARGVPASATPRSCAALAKLKSYLDYGTFQPIQIAATVAMNEAPDYPTGSERDLPRSRRDALFDGLEPRRLGHRAAQGDDVRLGADPGALRGAGQPRVRRAARARGARSRCRPASGFGPGGEGFVRFALVENEQRIRQAVRGIRRVLEQG